MPKVEGTMLSSKGKALLVFFVWGAAMRLGAPRAGGVSMELGTTRVGATGEAVNRAGVQYASISLSLSSLMPK
jgi:hypothetical protein